MGTQPWERSSVEFVATGFLKPEITSLKISAYVNIILYYLKILLSTENIIPRFFCWVSYPTKQTQPWSKFGLVVKLKSWTVFYQKNISRQKITAPPVSACLISVYLTKDGLVGLTVLGVSSSSSSLTMSSSFPSSPSPSPSVTGGFTMLKLLSKWINKAYPRFPV